MKQFMDEDFLLSNDIARNLYHDYAEKMPILDYHCHISQKEIYEDKQYKTITELWLDGDHYKWRQMRAYGIDEKYITGDASDFEKFKAWADTLSHLIGNPLYHWSNLELQRYFGIYEPLTIDNAEEIFNKCNEKLQTLTVRKILEKSNVDIICTTDDPIDDLSTHKLIKEDKTLKTTVLPCFRPDKALGIEKDNYLDYIFELSKITNIKIKSFDDLCAALDARIEFFDKMGCKVSDHGLLYIMYKPAEKTEIDNIFNQRLDNKRITFEEELKFKTALLQHLGRKYCEFGWAMQLHYGVIRDNNSVIYKSLGPDAGIDAIYNYGPSDEMIHFLDSLQKDNKLPKVIIYSLNPADNATIVVAANCFQTDGIKGKIQHGSAWWFNDHKDGIQQQLKTLAANGNLSTFIGMLTDSRSFLSYTRHEYFRRILCDYIGTLVENGEYPNDEKLLKEIVEDICYYNAVNYFEFKNTH